MSSVCLCFQIHQPYRLRHYSALEVGTSHDYFDARLDRIHVTRDAHGYRFLNALLGDLIATHEAEPHFSFSISGSALEQLLRFAPDVVDGIRTLCESGRVELLGESYFRGSACLGSAEELDAQIGLHRGELERLFGVAPTTFRSTEPVTDLLAKRCAAHGFTVVLGDCATATLAGGAQGHVHRPTATPRVRLLPSTRRRDAIPAALFARRLAQSPRAGDVVNLCVDVDGFGTPAFGHAELFTFVRELPDALLGEGFALVTPSEAARRSPAHDVRLDVASFERSANALQRCALAELRALREPLLSRGDTESLRDWRRLTLRDHVDAMANAGDTEAGAFDSPHAAYVAFMNVLADLALRAGTRDHG